jgi:hypothetical protein
LTEYEMTAGVRRGCGIFGSAEKEKAYRQYVSRWMFSSFGIRPAVGSVFAENGDPTPGES